MSLAADSSRDGSSETGILKRPRILIAGGGTGGHIIPALAVARELVGRYDAKILFVGTARGMESRMVPAAGFALKLIEVGPLNQVSMATRIRTMVQLPLSLLACSRILSEFKPDAVFGVGGYASGPAMGAAILRGIPTMAFEPNAVPGMANRLIGKRVKAAAVNFRPAAKWFRNAAVTGIPVRPEFFHMAAPPAGTAPHLLIFGGSQGARIFNTLMPSIAVRLLAAVPGLTLMHQAGARHVEATRTAYEAAGAETGRWRVEAFVDDMAAGFGAAHLVMARSGASTVAELAAASKPALLIPFAAAADDHQRSNAEVMVGAGAAVMLQEKEVLDGTTGAEVLLRTLIALLGDAGLLATMAAGSQALAKPGAAGEIAGMLVKLG